MQQVNPTKITVQTIINAPVEIVWNFWNDPNHIVNWCYASPDWHAPFAENDLQPGGKLRTTMAAKDGSMQFDFGGVYTIVEEYKTIAFDMGDGRAVIIYFTANEDGTTYVEETFDAETSHPLDMQKAGWQLILDRFKLYVEESQNNGNSPQQR